MDSSELVNHHVPYKGGHLRRTAVYVPHFYPFLRYTQLADEVAMQVEFTGLMGATIGTCQINRLDFRSSKPWPYEASDKQSLVAKLSKMVVYQCRYSMTKHLNLSVSMHCNSLQYIAMIDYIHYISFSRTSTWFSCVSLHMAFVILSPISCRVSMRINANHDSWQVTSDNKVVCGIELCVVEDEPLAPWIRTDWNWMEHIGSCVEPHYQHDAFSGGFSYYSYPLTWIVQVINKHE